MDVGSGVCHCGHSMADHPVWDNHTAKEMMIKCECFPTPPEYWTTHYGATDPATMIEFNPDCLAHGGPNFGPKPEASLTAG